MNLLEKEDLIKVKAEELEHAAPEEIIRWAVETFPNITFACSFGAEDVVLVDMIQKVSPSTDVFYLDTDYHFKETYETRDIMADKYGMEFVRVSPQITVEEQALQYGEALWNTDPNQCCAIRKVEPLTRILSQYDAWITGIRRDQAPYPGQCEEDRI